eukprot:460569-Amphidinium_carterae.1
MQRNPEERDSLVQWLHDMDLPGVDFAQQEVDALEHAAKLCKSKVSGGLDGWSASVLPLLPHDFLPPLALMCQHFEHHAFWPSDLCDVRVQLIPKKPELSYHVVDLRPISAASIWYILQGGS